MTTIDELMRLREECDASAVSQYQAWPTFYKFSQAAHAALPELVRELRELREQWKDARLADDVGEWKKLTAERDALKVELAALDACNTRDINALAAVQTEVKRLKAEVDAAEALEDSLWAQIRELREAALAHCKLPVHPAHEQQDMGTYNRLLDSRMKLRSALTKVSP